ncbi:MAG: class I SAM-dependent methyltransferase [Pirellulaceae bacterium]
MQEVVKVKGRQSGMPEEEYWASFFKPDCILSRLECDRDSGDIVEFGCGYGLFTESSARRTAGKVYALDIEAEMVDATRRRLDDTGLNNVIVGQRDFVSTGCGRPDHCLGYAMLFNILHIEDPIGLLEEAYRVLRPSGKVGVIHWNDDESTPRGPSMDIRPRPEQCQAWMQEVGFQNIRFDPLTCCPYHYGFVAER